MPQLPQIERYSGRDVPCEYIPSIGHSRQSAARPGLESHSHPCFEVCLIDDGHPEWFAGSDIFPLQPGSTFLARPNQRHGSTRDVLEPCDLRWLQFEVRRSELAAIIAKIRRTVWPTDSQLASLHSAMLEECRDPQPDSDRVLLAQLGLFITLLARSEARADASQCRDPIVERLRAIIDEHPEHPWTVAELLESASVGRTHLHNLFQRDLGMSPIAYARRVRLRRAQELLASTDRSITNVAHELGFASSQHFATMFSRQYGVSPTEFRRSEQL